MLSQVESDAAFARRLQEEELRNSHAPSHRWRQTGLATRSRSRSPRNDSGGNHAPSHRLPSSDEQLGDRLDSSSAVDVPLINRRGSTDNQVRFNIARGVEEQRHQSGRLLALSLFLGLAELIATSVVLGQTWTKPCDQPLQWWLLAFTSRVLVLTPLSVMRFRQARGLGGAGQGQFSHTAQQVYTYTNMAVFILFIWGQTWLYSSKSCDATLHTYSLVLVILVYVSLALPLVLLVGMCVCLPCILVFLRIFGDRKGADDTAIRDLPTEKFSNSISGETGDQENSGGVGGGDDGEEGPSCSICMVEYESGDELRVLPCGHRFHSQCVDRWLKIKRECPLCRHDITAPPVTNTNSNNSQRVDSADPVDNII